MKKFKKIHLIAALSVSAFSILFCIFLLKMTHTSYAIETGTFTSGFPTSSFSTNLDGSISPVNYVSSALSGNTTYDNYLSNFNVYAQFADDNNTNPLYVLMKNLEIPKSTETFGLTDESVISITNDKKLTYIINHGYNITNSVNTIFTEKDYGSIDNKTKQYVTQVALWLYIFENKSSYSETYCKDTGNGYAACDFYDNSNTVIDSTTVRTIINTASANNSYKYLKYITDLVDEAKNYSGGGTSSIANIGSDLSYSFTSTNDKIYVNNITPNITGNKSNYLYYAVEIEDPNSYGAYIADSNGNEIDNTNQMTGSFSVVVPLNENEAMDLTTIKVKVYAYFVLDNNKSYRVTSSTSEKLPGAANNLVVVYNGTKYDRYSDVILGYTPYQIISTDFRLSNFAKISKIDATTSNELPGATLVVTSKSDSTNSWTWVSTDQPHYITLEDGDYTLCETIAPSGYQPKTECVDFSVSGSQVNEVTFENEPITIPDTARMFNRMIVIIGLILIISGCGIISYFTFFKNKKVIQ